MQFALQVASSANFIASGGADFAHCKLRDAQVAREVHCKPRSANFRIMQCERAALHSARYDAKRASVLYFLQDATVCTTTAAANLQRANFEICAKCWKKIERVAAGLLLSERAKFAKEMPVGKICAEHKCAARRRVPVQQFATIMQVCIGCSKWLPLRATDARSLITRSADDSAPLCAARDCSASARTADFFGTAADAANNFFGYYMEEQRVCEERKM